MAEIPQTQANNPLKYTVTHYRQPQHTHEDFIKWITEEHLPLAIPVYKKHGIIEYSLFITPSPLNDELKESFSKFRPDWQFADFDCFIEYTIPDMLTIQKVMSDPDWQVAIKDQDNWVDMSKALVSLGYHIPYLLKTGEVVTMAK